MRIAFDDALSVMREKLVEHGTSPEKAGMVAYEMARNSLEGTYTHGINRFARLVRGIDSGIVIPGAEPTLISSFGAIERYDGNLGFGITNALFAMDRAMAKASEHGIGMAGLVNTNHWMRAATYGYHAVEKGYAAICFTNTIPNMPAWGAVDSRLGNNPFVMAFPRKDGRHMVFDSAMTQFSYGALEVARLAGERMSVAAGFDKDGFLSDDPAAVLETRRMIPAGFWKGSALSFLLDIFASCITLGRCVADISRLEGDEHGVSQLFFAIDYGKMVDEEEAYRTAERAIAFLKESKKADGAGEIVYPGERMMRARERNLREGIPVDDGVWNEILSL